jgi:excisionase family DNA binding protein
MSSHAGTIRRLLTSAAAARLLGVGVSTLKRWTDEGRITAIRTAGGHRRYDEDALRGRARTKPRASTPADLDAIGEELRELGLRWERGEIGVEEEHRVSNALAFELDSLRPEIPEDAPLALLACPPGELHDLPLRLVRLTLEWRGWRTDFLGASTPWDAIERAVRAQKPQLLALTAREPIDTARLQKMVKMTRVVIGGSWARGPGGGEIARFRSLRAFDRFLGSW